MDAFKDLWDNAAPAAAAAQAAKSQSLNAAAAQASARSYNRPDTFALLSSAPGSRTLTPSLPAQRPTSAASVTRPASEPRNGDAFSNLMSFSSSAAASSNLSLSDRQAKMEAEKKERERQQHEEYKSQGAFWDKFGGDDLLQPTPVPAAPTMSTASRTATPALQPTRPSPIPQASPKLADTATNGFDLLDFDSLSASAPVSKPASKPASSAVSPAPAAASPDPFDFAAFEGPPSRTDSLQVPQEAGKRSSTPGSFDFGEREDKRWGGDTDEEDDILGALSRPVVDRPREEPVQTAPTQPPRPTASSTPGPPRHIESPPPHIIGQIVEMGFSPDQARFALSTTTSGVDVQAALDLLLAQQAALESEGETEERRVDHTPERVLRIEHDSDEEAAIAAVYEQEREEERRRRRRQGPTRQTMNSSPHPFSPRGPGSPHPREKDSTQKMQEQADRLIAQASDFSMNMFNKANALWKQGKEQVQKAYEERKAAQASAAGGSGGPGGSGGGWGGETGGRARTESGKPKWAEESRWEEPTSPMSPVHRHEGGFRDEDDSHPSPHRHRHQHHEVAPPAPRAAEPNRPRQRPEVQQERKPEPAPRQERRQPAKEANLFSDEPIGYVSPARRRRPAEVASPARPTVPPEAATPPQPKPRPQRPSVPITPAARSASDTNKAKGTEFFRLGQFAEAEVAYSKALDVLPEGASARILVLNNRAASRLRTGNSAGVVEDSGAVLTLLVLDGAEYNPTSEEDWEGVKLGDALVKALTRRAEAWEMSEKWDKAADDWQRVVSLGTWIGKPKWDIANRGLDRCKRMKGGGETATAPAVSKPKPKPKPVVIGAPGKPSEAVTRLQQANQEQDEEENLRAQLKDSVDARLIAWKGGKETNIRALIASLDMVLWEELEWKRVNLGELVSPAQVKAKYVRAIARLHPDKLSASKATVEHKMIANGVFGALNDAWNAFQQQG